MKLNRPLALVAGAAGALVLALLMAPTPSGSSSRPTFQTVSAIAARTNAAAPITTASASAAVRWNETDQAADAKMWELTVTGSSFLGRTLDDSGAAIANWLSVGRAGSAPNNVTLAIGGHSFDISTSRAAIHGAATRLLLDETDAPTDEKIYEFAQVAGLLTLGTRTDADGAGAAAISINRTGTTVDSINLAATSVTVNGSPITAATSGTFVASFETACSTTPTITYDWTRSGEIVVLFPVSVSGFPCTGDSTSFISTSTPVPAAIRPSSIVYSPPHDSYTDNGANTWASVSLLTDGNIRFNECTAFTAICNPTGWTASANRGAPAAMAITYMLGNP